MDAASVFRQVEGFGTYPQRLPPQAYHYPNRPIKVEDTGEHESSHRIAHTLTACCRCRQVSMPSSMPFHTHARDIYVSNVRYRRGKRAVILPSPVVSRVNVLVPSANTSTPLKARRSTVYMSSSCKRRSGRWRQSWAITPTKMISPRTTKTS